MSELKKFRIINKIEGWSFIVLIFIAMPMKYVFGYPLATKFIGMAHGALFAMFCYQLIVATRKAPFTKRESLFFFVASLVPFGTFYTDRIIARYQRFEQTVEAQRNA